MYLVPRHLAENGIILNQYLPVRSVDKERTCVRLVCDVYRPSTAACFRASVPRNNKYIRILGTSSCKKRLVIYFRTAAAQRVRRVMRDNRHAFFSNRRVNANRG